MRIRVGTLGAIAAIVGFSACPAALAAPGDVHATLVKDINPGAFAGSSPGSIVQVGGIVLFSADDGTHGDEVWKTDGTAAGTIRLSDINPGAGDAINGSREFVVAGDTAFFRAFDGTEQELYKVGPPHTSVTEIDINPSGSSGAADNIGAVGDEVYFGADGGTGDGIELWKSDGGPVGSGTVQIADINTTPGESSRPEEFTPVGGSVFFTATDGEDGVDGRELWRTDGTVGDKHEITINAAADEGSDPRELEAAGGRVFLIAVRADVGEEIWTADEDDTSATVIDIVLGSSDSNPNELGSLGSSVIFDPDDGVTGAEPWKSNGGSIASGGTAPIADINPGAPPSDPSQFIPLADRSYFVAHEPTAGVELWRTNLGPLGPGNTERVADLFPGTTGSSPALLAVVGESLWFAAVSPGAGDELWRTDGSLVRSADINSGPGGSGPQQVAPGPGGAVYFSASDGSSAGRELWKATIEPAAVVPEPPAPTPPPKKCKKGQKLKKGKCVKKKRKRKKK